MGIIKAASNQLKTWYVARKNLGYTKDKRKKPKPPKK